MMNPAARTVSATTAACPPPPSSKMDCILAITRNNSSDRWIQELLPRTLEVRIDPAVLPDTATAKPVNRRMGRGAGELFAEYLASRGHDDAATVRLFHRLYEEVA